MESNKYFSKENIVSMTLSSIIPTLVSGLYNDTFDLVREYCQNSYDAILLKYGDSAEVKGKIDITIEKQNIIIHDNGTGMPYEIVRKCAVIGFSSKDVNNQVGYRGVGRLSGICAAEKIHFVTKIEGNLDEYLFEIDAKNLVSSLDRETKFTKKASDVILKYSKLCKRTVNKENKAKSYTTVILYNIHGEAGKLLDENKLKEYLEMNLPVFINPILSEASKINMLYRKHEQLFPNIKIFLNGKQIFKPFNEMKGRKKFKSFTLKNSRKRTLAVGWFIWDSNKSCMVEQKRIRGLRYRYRGFTVGNNEYVKSILNTSPPQIPDWFIGEIIILDDRVKISSDRSRFEDTQCRSEIEKSLKKHLAKELEKIARTKSSNASQRRVIEKAKEHLDKVENKNKKSKFISKEEQEILSKKSAEKIRKLDALAKKKTISDSIKNEIVVVKNDITKSMNKLRVKENAAVDLEKVLKRSPIALKVHKITVKTIKNQFDNCESCEELISYIGNELLKKVN